MSEQIYGIFYYVMYAAELFFVGQRIFHNRVREKRKYVIMAALYISVIVAAVLFMEDYFIIELGLNILMYIFLFQGKVSLRLVHFWGVYIYTNILESMICGVGIFLLQPMLKHMDTRGFVPNWILVLLAMISGVFAYIIAGRKWTQKFIDYFRALRWFQYMLIAVTVLSGILLIIINTVILERSNNEIGRLQYITTIALLGMVYSGIVWYAFSVYNKDYYVKQNQLKEKIIYGQQMYYQEIYERDMELRKFRHDIHSQLGCLQLLLSEGRTEQAMKHLSAIEKHLKEISHHNYHTGSDVLDVIINQKYSEAKEKGIIMEIKGEMTKPDLMDIYDLCVLFSNVLDNSIEACEKIQDKEKRITVSILAHNNILFFQFANPATPEMYMNIKQGRTSKEDRQKHGFGVENIQMVVRRNKGGLEYVWKDGILTLEIYFEIEK